MAAGVPTVERLGSMTPEDLEAIEGIGAEMVESIQLAVNSYYGQFEGSVETPPEAAAAPAEAIEASAEPAEAPAEPAAAPAEAAPATPEPENESVTIENTEHPEA